MTTWHKIEDVLPDENVSVLCTGFCHGNPDEDRWYAVAISSCGYLCDVDTGDEFGYATHWMPLPEFKEES